MATVHSFSSSRVLTRNPRVLLRVVPKHCNHHDLLLIACAVRLRKIAVSASEAVWFNELLLAIKSRLCELRLIVPAEKRHEIEESISVVFRE